MKRFLSLLSGLAIIAAASTANAQIDWAAGAPDGTSGGSIELVPGGNISLPTGIAAAQVAPASGADYTIAAWIQSTEASGVDPTLAASNRWWIGTGLQGLHLGVQGPTAGLTTGHWNNDSTGTTSVMVNTWVHTTHVYRSGVQEIYINGVLDSSVAAGAPDQDGTDLQIGSRNGALGPGWSGFIDDVAIFTSALSAAEVATLAGDSSQAVALGAAAYYNFEDDQSGTTAANLVSVAASGLTGTDGSPALQELDGIGAGLPSVADWTAGAPGGTPLGAVTFDGSSSLDTGIASALVGGNVTDGGSDYTVSAWINSAEDDGAGNATEDRWWFGTGFQGLHFGLLDGSTLRHAHWNADNSGTTAVAANTWVHAAFTYDADGGSAGTGSVTMYINGVADGTFDAAAPNVSSTDLIIGNRNGNVGPGWNGAIDDLAIFTSALPAADVATLFADTSQAVALGAAAYYNFEDDQTGTTAANLVDVAVSGLTGSDGSPAFQVLDQIAPNMDAALKGDVNLDGEITFLDINPFIAVLSSSGNQAEADCNCDGVVSFLDIQPFINILAMQ